MITHIMPEIPHELFVLNRRPFIIWQQLSCQIMNGRGKTTVFFSKSRHLWPSDLIVANYVECEIKYIIFRQQRMEWLGAGVACD